MINFFRKTRKKLANDNKFLKYSRYAIGEIVLVVIGILIALSINNWNEDRKLMELELQMLRGVKDGLKADLDVASYAIKTHKGFINSQQTILDWMENDKPFHDSLAPHFMRTFFHTDFISKNAPYETLKSAGLEIIKNDSLRNQISNLYELKYERLSLANDEQLIVKNDYRRLMGENRFVPQKPFGCRPLHVTSLKSDATYLFNLRMTQGGLQNFNGHLKRIIPEIEQLIVKLEFELDRR